MHFSLLQNSESVLQIFRKGIFLVLVVLLQDEVLIVVARISLGDLYRVFISAVLSWTVCVAVAVPASTFGRSCTSGHCYSLGNDSADGIGISHS